MTKKKTSKIDRLAALEKENARLRKALSKLISTWRDHDHVYGEACFDACQAAKAVLEGTSNKLTGR
jgi:hypothetical protein